MSATAQTTNYSFRPQDLAFFRLFCNADDDDASGMKSWCVLMCALCYWARATNHAVYIFLSAICSVWVNAWILLSVWFLFGSFKIYTLCCCCCCFCFCCGCGCWSGAIVLASDSCCWFLYDRLMHALWCVWKNWFVTTTLKQISLWVQIEVSSPHQTRISVHTSSKPEMECSEFSFPSWAYAVLR